MERAIMDLYAFSERHERDIDQIKFALAELLKGQGIEMSDLATLQAALDDLTTTVTEFVSDSQTASAAILNDLEELQAAPGGSDAAAPDLTAVIAKVRDLNTSAAAADAALRQTLAKQGSVNANPGGGATAAGGSDTTL